MAADSVGNNISERKKLPHVIKGCNIYPEKQTSLSLKRGRSDKRTRGEAQDLFISRLLLHRACLVPDLMEETRKQVQTWHTLLVCLCYRDEPL